MAKSSLVALALGILGVLIFAGLRVFSTPTPPPTKDAAPQPERTVNGVTKVIRANYRKLAEGNEPDIPLMDGDTIWLKESFL